MSFEVNVPDEKIKYGLCIEHEGSIIVAYVFDDEDEAHEWLRDHPGEPEGAVFIKEVVAMDDLTDSLADEAESFLTE